MKDRKLVCCILFLTVYTLFSYWIYEHTMLFIHKAILWNLFLALIPLGLAMIYQKIAKSTHPIIHIGLCLSWLLIFPNAPYMITDVIHVSPILFYEFTEQGTIYIQNMMAWMQLLQLMTGILIGFVAGMKSLKIMIHQCDIQYGSKVKWVSFVCICIFSGYGVFLGRFLRLNSWDVFQPGTLFLYVIRETNVFAVQFSLCFALLIAISYGLFQLFEHKM